MAKEVYWCPSDGSLIIYNFKKEDLSMVKKRKQAGALLLSAALLITQLPTTAMAENLPPEDGSIASFEALDGSVRKQTVPTGTELTELNLPETVTADIYHIMDGEDELILDEDEELIASPSEAGKRSESSTRSAEEIFVTWDSSPTYDGDAEGKYLFTADVDGYTLSEGVRLPQITVTVAGESISPVKNISGWSFAEDEFLNEGVLPLSRVSIDNQADFDTVVSMLPTQIQAEIDDGESTAIGQEESGRKTVEIIGWKCPEYQEDGQGNWPVSGEYIFTASLESGYRCNPLPSVKVLLGGASLFTINDRFAVDGFLYKELGPDTVQLIGYEGDKPEGELHIPSQIVRPENGRSYEVVSIGSKAFLECGKLTGSLVIPDTVTKICDQAFLGCGFDGALVLPDGLTEIGSLAFAYCFFTGTLKLPDSLTEIGSAAFQMCSGFTGPLIIPKQITVIRRDAFGECSGIESLEMPEGLTEIQDAGFSGLSGIKTSITFPSSLTLIENSAFVRTGNDHMEFICPNLTIADLLFNTDSYAYQCPITINGVPYSPPQNNSIYVSEMHYDEDGQYTSIEMKYVKTGSDTVTAAGPRNNEKMSGRLDIPREVTDADGKVYIVTAIGKNAFDNNRIHIEVRIPDTVTEIKNQAFFNTALIGTLELPPGLTSIGDRAFMDCNTLTGPLVIPDTVTEIGNSAFYRCQGFDSLTLPPGLNQISDGTFAYCTNLTGTLSLPSGVTRIGEQAFYGCPGLTGAFLDKNITSIGWYAFDPGFPLTTNSPRIQLLINEYHNRENPVDTFWDGGEDIPDGALVTVNQDVTLEQDRRIGIEAESTIQKGSVMTVNKHLTVDGRLVVQGTLIINGTLTGSGTLYIARGGRVIGDISGIKVEYEPAPPSGGGGGSYTNPDILRGTWTLTETGIWMFRQTGGEYAKSRWGLIGGLWYYFNADGHMLTGWQQLGGVWYYLNTADDAKSAEGISAGVKEGAMKTGWHYDTQLQGWFWFDASGAMVTGDKEIDGKPYHFNPESDGKRGILVSEQ